MAWIHHPTHLTLLFLLITGSSLLATVHAEANGPPKSPEEIARLAAVIESSVVGTHKTIGVDASTPQTSAVSVQTVALLTFFMAAATGLGSIPFFFFEVKEEWGGICNGVASGVMLAASFDLISEGQAHGGGHCVVIGIVLGGLFIIISQKALERFGDMKLMDVSGADARRLLLVIAIMTLHSFGEGSGVGVSFAGPNGLRQGVLVTLAIAVHNVPEGLAVCMVMAGRGMSPRNSALWSIFTSMPQFLVAVPAYLCAQTFSQFLPLSVGFAAGCMIWIVFAEVMPESLESGAKASYVATAATASIAFMEGASTVMERLSLPSMDGQASAWERMLQPSSPLLLSPLFILGPLLGASLLSLLHSLLPPSRRPPSPLLAGLSAGVMIALASWRPLHLLFSQQLSPLSLGALLCLGNLLHSAMAAVLLTVPVGGKGHGADGPSSSWLPSFSATWVPPTFRPSHKVGPVDLECSRVDACVYSMKGDSCTSELPTPASHKQNLLHDEDHLHTPLHHLDAASAVSDSCSSSQTAAAGDYSLSLESSCSSSCSLSDKARTFSTSMPITDAPLSSPLLSNATSSIHPTPSSPLKSSTSFSSPLSTPLWWTPSARVSSLVSLSLSFHALAEGLMLGVAALQATGQGQGSSLLVLLPASIHGLPRGVAAAGAVLGVNKGAPLAMLAALHAGLAAPVGAMSAMAVGLSDYTGLDCLLVVACGCLLPTAIRDVLPKAVNSDRKRTIVGLLLGIAFVFIGLSGNHLMCMSTHYCNAAPEAVR